MYQVYISLICDGCITPGLCPCLHPCASGSALAPLPRAPGPRGLRRRQPPSCRLAQPYDAAQHTVVSRTTWGIASPVEYDVPKCGEGMAGCSRAADGSWIHTINGTFTGGGRLAAAHFHCHAPTCLSVAMYRCNMSAVSECNASTGELLCDERPVYGGTGRVDDRRFDEPGYILQPPCLWGDAKYGLQPPPDTTGYTLHSVPRPRRKRGAEGPPRGRAAQGGARAVSVPRG